MNTSLMDKSLPALQSSSGLFSEMETGPAGMVMFPLVSGRVFKHFCVFTGYFNAALLQIVASRGVGMFYKELCC